MIVSIILYSFISAKFIIMNMSKSEYEIIDEDVTIYFLLTIMCFFINDVSIVGFLFSIYGMYIILRYMKFIISVINQIMKHLKITF